MGTEDSRPLEKSREESVSWSDAPDPIAHLPGQQDQHHLRLADLHAGELRRARGDAAQHRVLALLRRRGLARGDLQANNA